MSEHTRSRPAGEDSSSSATAEASASGPNFSRRTFLKSVGVTPVVAAAIAPDTAEAQTATVVGPDAAPLTLTINGQKKTVTVEPRTTLLDAMRQQLDLTGAKRVCDRGSCGACTVMIDKRTAYACSVLAVDAEGADIRTIEGLTQGTVLHPVQQAHLREGRHDVRLLHAGLRDVDGGAAREDAEPDGGAGQEGARRQHLPLRHVRAAARSRAVGEGRRPWLTNRCCQR